MTDETPSDSAKPEAKEPRRRKPASAEALAEATPTTAKQKSPSDHNGSTSVAQAERPSGTVEIVHGGLDDVEADSVNVTQGGINTVSARTVALRQGGISRAEADDISVTMGGIGAARGERVSVELGGIGAAMASEVRVTQGYVGPTLAREVHIEQGFIRQVIASRVSFGDRSGALIVIAARVDGQVRALLDWRGALAFGAAFGIIAGLFRRGRR